MKKIFFAVVIICSTASIAQAQLQLSYFIQADADDWQLYMSKKVSADLNAGGKAVMITLTAGDEGHGTGSFNSSPIAYYLAREQGAVNSSKTISDISYAAYYPFSYAVPTAQVASINGKNIVKYTYGDPSGVANVVSYFLRLPDGGPTGAGFAATSNQSLMKLKMGNITSITSIDGANTYTSWNDLVETILQIILAEKGSDPQFYINTSNLNAGVNPGDHSDHIYSSTAVQEAVNPYLAIGINEFIFDHSSTLPNNISDDDYESAVAAFSSYGWSLINNKYPSVFTTTNRGWLHQEYSSIKRSPIGALPVSLLDFSGSLLDKKVVLKWSTSAEYNSKQFVIEKSSDGITYNSLGAVPAAGNSVSLKSYTYEDRDVLPINYYRLKMYDIDGTYKQSNVVVIRNNLIQQSIIYVSNPFTNDITIKFEKVPEKEISVKLFDMSGRMVYSTVINKLQSQLLKLETSRTNISSGLYMLHLACEGNQYNFKVLKN